MPTLTIDRDHPLNTPDLVPIEATFTRHRDGTLTIRCNREFVQVLSQGLGEVEARNKVMALDPPGQWGDRPHLRGDRRAGQAAPPRARAGGGPMSTAYQLPDEPGPVPEGLRLTPVDGGAVVAPARPSRWSPPAQEPTMTAAQEAKLRRLCTGAGIEFDPANYTRPFDLPAGWVAGWVGTLYVGVDPEGNAST